MGEAAPELTDRDLLIRIMEDNAAIIYALANMAAYSGLGDQATSLIHRSARTLAMVRDAARPIPPREENGHG